MACWKTVFRLLWTAFAVLTGIAWTSVAHGAPYALASKSLDDPNFVMAFQAFSDEAIRQGDSAVHVGAPGPSHFRTQDNAIQQAMQQELAGMALSVTYSQFLAQNSLKSVALRHLPLVTFYSDLERPLQGLRKAYVGPDNQEFGRSLGELARKLRPHGGTVWLMTADERNPNLDERIQGVRIALSGDAAHPHGKRLTGEGGWTENPRSPWICGDDPPRAMEQMRISLREDNDVLLSVGHWPVLDAAAFVETTLPHRAALISGRRLILAGTGTPSPGQLDLLRQHLVAGLVTIDFQDMGRLAFRLLKKVARGESVPERTITRSLVLEPG